MRDHSRHQQIHAAAWTYHPTSWLSLACLLTILAYLPGLSGPFLLDDSTNLEPLGNWLAGTFEWRDVVFGNMSGLFGRPLAMVSFMLDARLFGGQPLPYKITNLIIHIICGLLIFILCRRLFECDRKLHDTGPWWALGVAAVWLLHPIQVSTVLYVVQRMTQLSTLFTLVALLCYLRGRRLLERAQTEDNSKLRSLNHASTSALAWLFAAFPIATLAALLCKENGALAPLYALAIELAYFHSKKRPRALHLFFLAFLVLPGLGVVGWYATHPDSLLLGYETRDFTLGQRLLSEPRALVEYLDTLLLPRGAALGLYGDDFYASTGLLSPPSTLAAILFWIVAISFAWLLRKNNPTFSVGIFLYVAGHAMESTVLPLELYFEHRNYLPSVGIFIALAALVERGTTLLASRLDARRLVHYGAVAAVLAFSVATHARAWSWRTWSVIVVQAAALHPNSMRAQLDLATLFIRSDQLGRAYEIFDQLRDSPSSERGNVGVIAPMVLDCQAKGAMDPLHLADAHKIIGKKIGTPDINAVKMLADQLNIRPCKGFSESEFAHWTADLARNAPQKPSTFPIWTLRHIAADFFRRIGNLQRAREEAAAAWSASANAHIGLLLVNILLDMGEMEQAERMLSEVQPSIRRYDRKGQDLLIATEARLIRSMEAHDPKNSGGLIEKSEE